MSTPSGKKSSKKSSTAPLRPKPVVQEDSPDKIDESQYEEAPMMPSPSAPASSATQQILDSVQEIQGTLGQVAFAISNLDSRVQALESSKRADTPDSSDTQSDDTPDSSSSKGSKANTTPRGVTKRAKKDRPKPRYSTLGDLATFRRLPEKKEQLSEESSDSELEEEAEEHLGRLASVFGEKRPGKFFRNLKRSAKVAQAKTVNITRLEKKCHVRIETFKLGRVSRAIKEILDFQEEEETEVRIQKVLSRNLKDHLRSVYDIQHAELASMDISDLMRIVALETKVFSCVGFYNELKESLSHMKVMEWDNVNAVNFEAFYFQQLRLIESFKRMLSIMLENESNRRWCPQADDKEYGLIRLFKTLNDVTYVKFVLGCIPKKKFDFMEDFFKLYTEVLLDHYQITIAYKQLPFKATVQHQAKYEEYMKRKREMFSRPKPGVAKNSTSTHSSTRLFNMEEEQASFSSNEFSHDEEDLWDAYGDTWKSNNHSTDVPTGGKPNGEPATETSEEKDTSDSEGALQAMDGQNPSHKPKQEKYGCMRKIMYGKCDKSDCRYSHNPRALANTASELAEKSQAYLKTTSSTSGSQDKPPAILRRDRFGDSRP